MLVALRIARNLRSVSTGIARRRGGYARPELVGACSLHLSARQQLFGAAKTKMPMADGASARDEY